MTADNLAVEFGGSMRRPVEERKSVTGVHPRSHRGTASPHKISKDPGESFLDLYADAEFGDLETAEIVSRLKKNLKSFLNFREKASRKVEELKERADSKDNSKEKEREINEELDKRMSQLYELEVRIKSIEQLIAKLEEERKLEEELARRNEQLRKDEEELQKKEDELVSEKSAKKEIIKQAKKDLTEQVNEVTSPQHNIEIEA
eukprot:TRINITY_DN13111_c0_g1_i2.p1 TRINITY_DN13111_c0_g1~~TRINITY_DN13111_c0_g1_i2.p1  ORF type:complete len:204 (+),score=89.49 TRINITY_DN13111_c0_g1_i2:340-951(+)